MAWRDRLQQASWRGVPFQVEGDELAVGRRTQVHEYPQRDKPFVEDLGRSARAGSITAFLIGADYMEQRDRLLAAIEEPGPGTLVHPFYGEMTVVLTGECQVTHSRDEGGMCRVTLAFTEAGELAFPKASADTASATRLAADEAQAASLDEFAETFDVVGYADFVATEALETISMAADVVDAVANFELGAALRRLVPANLLSAYAVGERLWNTVAGLGRDSAGEAAGDGMSYPTGDYTPEAVRRYAPLTTYQTPAPPVRQTTPSRKQEAANREAVEKLVRRAALVESARASADTEWPVYDDAIQVRDDLSHGLETEAAAAEEDTVFRSLYNLRLATVQDITTRASNASRLRDLRPPVTLPADVIAYDLYEDAGRAPEIVARNRVRHPGFVPPEPLKVLNK